MTALPHPDDRLDYETRPLEGRLGVAADAFAAQVADASAVAVAFSGGVDSSVTLALSARALGRHRVVAVLGVSPSLADLERRQAHATAAALAIQCREIPTFELDDPAYVANRGNRCYFCKHELYTRAFGSGVRALGCDVFVNGDTADDLRATDRPGRRAAAELGVRSPLAEAGIGKELVRTLAHALGLEVWDKPSAPCLASRVPLHMPVTRERLAQVEQAEAGLRALGLRHLRVRHLGATARVELGAADIDAVEGGGLRPALERAVAAAGYAHVEVAAAPLERG
ncbi:ATP-dependent sacrificial sulfur transferase LarE [Nocardioides sp. R1-1]|uniref:ATP-dependent sacrificial sulfur transferase LarE n=1 Tax=Nocardioides sp. R1-1 TaxID=3383502 RepID=UPI0038CFAC75